MPSPKAKPVVVSEKEKNILAKLANSQTKAASLVMRAKIILYASEGEMNKTICQRLLINNETPRIWRDRWNFANELLRSKQERPLKELQQCIEEVLADKSRSGSPARISGEQKALIIALACEHPKESGLPLSHWTIQALVDEIKKRKIIEEISWTRVQNFLKESRIKTSQKQVLA